jgi:hypothetical protein
MGWHSPPGSSRGLKAAVPRVVSRADVHCLCDGGWPALAQGCGAALCSERMRSTPSAGLSGLGTVATLAGASV